MKSDMRARFSILLAIMMVVMLALMYFDPSQETYVGMQVQTAGGKPYLMLAEQETFGLYAPNGKDLESWSPLYVNRSGLVYGTFEIPPGVRIDQPEKTTPPNEPAQPGAEKILERRIEGLGVFFNSSCAVFDVAKADKNSGVASFPMSLNWALEATAQLDGSLYAFGAKLKPAGEEGAAPDRVLKAARFDGKTWTEVPNVTGPLVRSGNAGFWLKAVALEGRTAVLWRGAKLDQTIGYGVEGFRISTDGDIGMCFFDGMKFGAESIAVTGLPKGNTCVWAENGTIKCLVQTRLKGSESDGVKGRMEIWNIAPNGKAELAETIAPERHTMGLFSHIAAEHFKWEDREYILRSNWQKFELWRRNDAGKWELAPSGVAGLPIFTLEHKLYWALAFCAAVVLLGAWLGFLRRRHALTLLSKLRPSDLYAPLAARASAYVLDMLVVIAAAFGVSKLLFDQYTEILPLPLGAIGVPSTPFLICFLVYFAGSECLFCGTPGKLLMGLRVVADGGSRPSIWASLVRNTVGLLERQPMMLIVAAPMVIFSPRRQRLGDLLSRTFVVQKQGLDLFIAQKAAAAVESMDKLPGETGADKAKDK